MVAFICVSHGLCVCVWVEGGDDGRSAVLARGCFNGSSDLELMAAALRMER